MFTKLIIFLFISLSILFACSFLIFSLEEKDAHTLQLSTNENIVEKTSISLGQKQERIINFIEQEKLIAVKWWEIGDDEKLICLVRRLGTNESKTPDVVLEIYNTEGSLLYQNNQGNNGDFSRIYSVYALRDSFPQLAVESNEGVSTSFISLLNYQDGKVTDLIDTKESDFNVSCEITPYIKNDIVDTNSPFEILLKSRVGSTKIHTTILHYQNGLYTKNKD